MSCTDGYMYACDMKFGTLQWKFNTLMTVYSSPAIGADGKVYFGSYNGVLYALDGANNGALVWSYQTPAVAGNAGIVASPAIGYDGTIYVGSWNYNMYAISSTGTLKWQFVTGANAL